MSAATSISATTVSTLRATRHATRLILRRRRRCALVNFLAGVCFFCNLVTAFGVSYGVPGQSCPWNSMLYSFALLPFLTKQSVYSVGYGYSLSRTEMMMKLNFTSHTRQSSDSM